MNTNKKINFENMTCVYMMMAEIANKKVKSYKSDVEHDFDYMSEHEENGLSFLWAVRESGTWLRPFQTNNECRHCKDKEEYKNFMYNVLDLSGWLGVHQDYYIVNMNYHGKNSIEHVSKENAKKAIDTWLDSFEKYRLDIVWNGEVIDSTAPTRAEAERLVKEYKLGFHGGDFDIKAVAI